MSVGGLREKHIRAMAALEDVVRENKEMKAELKRLKQERESQAMGGGQSNVKVVELKTELKTTTTELRKAQAVALGCRQQVLQLQNQCEKLTADLNEESKRADDERTYVHSGEGSSSCLIDFFELCPNVMQCL